MPTFRIDPQNLDTHESILKAIADQLNVAQKYISIVQRTLRIPDELLTRDSGTKLLDRISKGNEAADGIQDLFEALGQTEVPVMRSEREKNKLMLTERRLTKVYYKLSKNLKELTPKVRFKLRSVVALGMPADAAREEERLHPSNQRLEEERRQLEKERRLREERLLVQQQDQQEGDEVLLEFLKRSNEQAKKHNRMIKTIATDAQEVSSMMQDLDALVDSTEAPIQIIAENTENTLANIREANKELGDASRLQIRQRNNTRCLLLAALFVLACGISLVYMSLN